MKKILLAVLLFSSTFLSAQTGKKYIARCNLGYDFSHKDALDLYGNGGYNGYFGKINKSLTLDLNAGRKLGDCFYIGAGVQLDISNQELNPAEDRPDSSIVNGTGFISSYTNTVNSTKAISPYLFVEYFYAINDRFTIASDLFVRYDLNKTSVRNSYFIRTGSGQPFVFSNEYFKETNLQNLGFGIRTSVRYDFRAKCGAEVTVGLMQYTFKLRDSRNEDFRSNAKTFNVSLMPGKWLLGFYWKI